MILSLMASGLSLLKKREVQVEAEATTEEMREEVVVTEVGVKREIGGKGPDHRLKQE